MNISLQALHHICFSPFSPFLSLSHTQNTMLLSAKPLATSRVSAVLRTGKVS